MKRIEQLQPLSKEHHLSLLLAQKAIKTARSGDSDLITTLCQEIINDYDALWRVHFQIEEDSIFLLIKNKAHNNLDPKTKKNLIDATQLCKQLSQEHLTMNHYYEQMKSKGNDNLATLLEQFGELLKEHTRTEERLLFPLLDTLLNSEELKQIYQTSLKYR